jgi:uncharacterized membrane protein
MKSPKESPLWFCKRWLLILGTLAVLSTLLSGLYAYHTVEHDVVSHQAMDSHRLWASSTAVSFLLATIFAYYQLRSRISGLLIMLSVCLMVVTAYKGGELVYRYGLGVMALPDTKEPHHHIQEIETKLISEQPEGKKEHQHHDHSDHHH